ncbi:hypothetical protein [uncultured Pseudoteredinibacter sp.]|uniref:hypothetical protein n=1 Tax=uncultured Pseudoteredinibacter sp. TaxID=1641701 RepID=UPI0026353B1C|nr:hypothetical protein [uncultured Pseudoteredinibacter sp.]
MTDLQFSPFQERCLKLVEESETTCRGRHSLRSAVNHLKRGWNIREKDPEMAVFRAITAEEEAAAGLFHALKYRKYDNAHLINPKNHVHKSAVAPFMQILLFFFGEFSETSRVLPKFHIKEENGDTRLRVVLPLVINGQDMWAYPIPPLNFDVSSDGKKLSFRPQIEKLLTDQNASDILKYVREQANQRNKILYAGPDGYPVIEDLKGSFFELRLVRVMVMVKAFLFIEPWEERQPFVQQSLDAFLVMLKRVENKMLHAEM